MAKYPQQLLSLIIQLQQLPGVGRKTAERFAFHLLKIDAQALESLGQSIAQIQQSILFCSSCGCIKENIDCLFCHCEKRTTDVLCIISSPRDAYAIDTANSYRGLYHVIDQLLSPLDGFDEKSLNIETLCNRIEKNQIKEVIIALDSTLEGDATALFLKEQLSKLKISISRLAFGLPVGSSLEYIDEGTLFRAFSGRQTF